MESEDLLEIEIVYAKPDEQVVIALRVPGGTTARGAILLSRLPEKYPEIDAGNVQVGIYGRKVHTCTVLRAGDRLEIHRPLVADPKMARRRRARKPG